MWEWVFESSLRLWWLRFSEAVIDFLGGSSKSQRPEENFSGGRDLTYFQYTYYSYLLVVDPNYLALFENQLFGRFSLFVHPSVCQHAGFSRTTTLG